jgi:hypothetical protein
MKKAALLVLLLSSAATAAELGWKDKDGNAIPETDSQKSVEGFGGLLVVTPDKDWQEKWNTSPETVPYFAGGSTVKKGGELFILTLFSNPQPDASGAASVSMDIDVTRPDGSSSSHVEDAVCAKGKVEGAPHHLYLCGQVVEFVGEPGDPVGTWSVRIVLKDDVRKVSMTLATKFELVAEQPTR